MGDREHDVITETTFVWLFLNLLFIMFFPIIFFLDTLYKYVSPFQI